MSIFSNHGIQHKSIMAMCPICEEETELVYIDECYCHVDVDGCGYTYADEHGGCILHEGMNVECQECYGEFDLNDMSPEIQKAFNEEKLK